MPFNGNGVFTNPYNWENDAANGIDILASRMNTQDGGIASGLSNVICKDGQQTTTAIIPFSGGGISLAAGTLLAPSCSIIGDSDTGFAQVSGAGTMAFISNGSKIVTFSGTGMNGPIGGTTPGAGSFTTITGTSSATLGANSGTIGSLKLNGSTSGVTTVVPNVAAGSGTLTLPVATDTLVGKATTDTLTNKTLDTAGTGNVLKVNGTAISAVTGTGAAVLATSPTLTTAALGNSTATTQASTDSSTKVATTAFANPSTTLGSTAGSVTLPGGLILKYGTQTSLGPGNFTITYPVAFPTATVYANFIGNTNNASTNSNNVLVSLSASAVTFGNENGATITAYWFALGF